MEKKRVLRNKGITALAVTAQGFGVRCECCPLPSPVASTPVCTPSTGGSLSAAAGASLGQERALSLCPTAKCDSPPQTASS